MFPRPYAYRHVVATLHGCSADMVDDKLILDTTLKAIHKANMQLAKTKTSNPLVYRVSDDIMGGGVSVNALITTSHLTVHTSRKFRTVEFDCATCGCGSNPWAALDMFRQALGPTHVTNTVNARCLPFHRFQRSHGRDEVSRKRRLATEPFFLVLGYC
jgi:S-adenosylmethionine/arginine decarboxylase-like enzyme